MTWSEEIPDMIPWKQTPGCWRLAEWWRLTSYSVIVLATGLAPRVR